MNIAASPEFVTAEVAYRFETGQVGHAAPAVPDHHHRVGRWLRGLVHPTRGQHGRARSHGAHAQGA